MNENVEKALSRNVRGSKKKIPGSVSFIPVYTKNESGLLWAATRPPAKFLLKPVQ